MTALPPPSKAILAKLATIEGLQYTCGIAQMLIRHRATTQRLAH